MSDQRLPPRWPGLLLAIGTLVSLLSTMDIGFTRDEGYYFKAGELYSYWFEEAVTNPAKAFSKSEVDRHWAYNPEHPSLMKSLFGLSWRLFGNMRDRDDRQARRWYHAGHPPKKLLGWMRESTAMRLPTALMAARLVYLVYRMGAIAFSVRIGLVSALATILMPRLFFHAHLACFDLPMTTMWFLTIYLFWRSLAKPGLGGVLATAVAWGLALDTKHNAYFIPIVLVLWWLPQAVTQFGILRQPGRGLRIKLPPIPASLVSMAIVGPIVLYLLWPKLWFDPIGHWLWYFKRHLHDEYYWAFYFGRLFANPPFPVEFPWVMTAVTVPTVTLLLAALGLWARGSAAFGRSKVREMMNGVGFVPGTDRLLLLNLLFPIAIFSTTKTPIFGGTKHWMPAMPYLAIFAGIGFEFFLGQVFQHLPKRPARLSCAGPVCRKLLAAGLAGLLLAPAVVGIARSHPDGSCYYNELLGGFRGMGEYGMQREFWGNSARDVLDWVNEHARKNARVFFHDTNYDSYLMYLRDGLLRPDIRYEHNIDKSDLALFHHHAEFLDREQHIWLAYGTGVPVYGRYLDGVPILSVYRKPRVTTKHVPNAGR